MLEEVTDGAIYIENVKLMILKRISMKYVQKWAWCFNNLTYSRI